MTDVEPAVSDAAVAAINRLGQRDRNATLAAPDAEHEPEKDGLVFVGDNGFIRLVSGGRTWRCRRPFLKELRTLDQAREAMAFELEAAREKTVTAGRRFNAEKKKVRDSKSLSDTKRAEKLKEISLQDLAAGNELIDTTDEALVAWWTLVFETLCLDGVPDDWPASIVDPAQPARAVNHWRSNP